MRIWHEQLIHLLCQKHLCACWREGLGAYKIITENKKGYRNHPAVKEFESNTFELWKRLNYVRKEMINRGYHPHEMPEVLLADLTYGKVKEWQTLSEQIAILKNKKCKCKV
jgi:hypothetical protein